MTSTISRTELTISATLSQLCLERMRLEKAHSDVKRQAIEFEDNPYALNYRRASEQNFWDKIRAGTRMRPASLSAARVVGHLVGVLAY
jgi:hypothetical protein